MSKDHPVTIGTRTFKSQKSAKVFFNVILNRTAIGERTSDADALELRALLANHPQRAVVVGQGTLAFEVAHDPLGARCFRVVRSDETSTLFSVRECVEHDPGAALAVLAKALREVVREDLEHARETYLRRNLDDEGYVACAVTGNRMMPADGHIDHRPPMTFDTIVTSFLTGQGKTPADVVLEDGAVPIELGRAFRAYHGKTAKLEFVMRHVKWSQAKPAKAAPKHATKADAARPGAKPAKAAKPFGKPKPGVKSFTSPDAKKPSRPHAKKPR